MKFASSEESRAGSRGDESRRLWRRFLDSLHFDGLSVARSKKTPYNAIVLHKLRHTLVLALFLLLPFHALFVTVGTKILLGPGHPPLPHLAVWKEVLMVVIFVIGIMEIATQQILPRYFQYVNILKVGQGGMVQVRWKADAPTILIVALLVLTFVVHIHHSQFSPLRQGYEGQAILNSQFLFGFKYLFLPLILFLLFKNLSWEEDFLERKLFPGILLISVSVALYGILTLYLPQAFFTVLGYSDAHSLYSPNAPLSAFQQIAGTGIRRIQGTFAGPNQLGMWMLIPWSIGLTNAIRCVMPRSAAGPSIRPSVSLGTTRGDTTARIEASLYLFLIGIALFLTFSRAAWIGAAVILLGACWMVLQGRIRAFVCSFFVCLFFVGIIFLSLAAPQLLLKGISTSQHLERMKEGIAAILEKPLGQGLGSAGPAANRTSDACLFFPARTTGSDGEEGADISWAKDREDLCLFVGETQVQPLPSERTCNCPLLPENWYLQVGIELGMFGLLFFLALIYAVFRSLVFRFSFNREFSILPTSPRLRGAGNSQLSILLVFLGISIAALFLHSWEDSAVAYTIWGIVGIVCSSSEARRAESRGV